MRIYRYFLLWLFLIPLSFKGKATCLVIYDSVDSYKAVRYLEYLEDENDEYTISNILDTPFSKVQKKRAIWGEKSFPFWFKLTLKNKCSSAQQIVFDIAYENINRLEFYIYRQGDSLPNLIYTLGNKIDFKSWPIKNRNLPVPFTLKKGQEITFYMKADFSREVQFPLAVRKINNYYNSELKQHYILGMYTGFFLIIVTLNLFFFFNFKDRIYIWYILLCATIGISVLTFEGMQIPFIVPLSKWLAINLDVFNAYAGVIASFIFVFSFLDMKKYTPYIFYSVFGICILLTIIVPVYLITDIHLIFVSEYILVSLCFILYLITGVVIMRKGFVHARTFVLAYTVILISIITWVISDYFIDVYKRIASEREMMIGSIIEMTVLSYALSVRMKQLREENERIRKMLVQYVNQIEELKHLIDNKPFEKEVKDKKLKEEMCLTEREIDVLQLIARGFTNSEIANKLFISVNTVKYHTKNIFEKLNASNRVEAILKVNQI